MLANLLTITKRGTRGFFVDCLTLVAPSSAPGKHGIDDNAVSPRPFFPPSCAGRFSAEAVLRTRAGRFPVTYRPARAENFA